MLLLLEILTIKLLKQNQSNNIYLDMENKIPTAEEFWINNRPMLSHAQIAIEFAKLHVKAALEAASEHVSDAEGVDFNLKKSYPLDNIK